MFLAQCNSDGSKCVSLLLYLSCFNFVELLKPVGSGLDHFGKFLGQFVFKYFFCSFSLSPPLELQLHVCYTFPQCHVFLTLSYIFSIIFPLWSVFL